MSQEKKQIVANWLWSVSERAAGESAFRFTSEAEDQMRRVITRATDQMEKEGVLEDEAHVRAAEFILNRVVTMMGTSALVTVGAEAALVNEMVLDKIFSDLCPLWPIC